MKKAWILLSMISWVVLVHGASFGAQSAQVREQTAATSDEKSDDKRSASSSRAGSNATQARGESDQTTESMPSDESQKSFGAVKAGTPKRRPSASHAKPAFSRQRRSAEALTANNPRTETPRNTLDSRQTGSTMSAEAPSKVLKHPGMPVPPPTVALSGQQFQNSRDRSARMAISGGSANSARGTAVINGSDIKRKP